MKKSTSSNSGNNKKVKKIAKVTIEDLAVMTQKGFSSLEVRMEERFDQIDRKFDIIDTRLDRVEFRLDRIENILARDLQNRIERLEDDMQRVKTATKVK